MGGPPTMAQMNWGQHNPPTAANSALTARLQNDIEFRGVADSDRYALRRRICHSGILLALFMTLANVVQAQFTYTTNSDNTITITGYTGSGGDVAIPDTIDGMAVTTIGPNAFYTSFNLCGGTIR